MGASESRDWVLENATELDRPIARAGDDIDLADTILARRAALLPPAQRTVVLLWLGRAHSLRSLGAALGVNPGTLCRRIARILRRLRDPVVAAIADFGADLPDNYRRIGLDRFLYGMSLRRIGGIHCLSRGEVLSILAYLKAWAVLRRQLQAEVSHAPHSDR